MTGGKHPGKAPVHCLGRGFSRPQFLVSQGAGRPLGSGGLALEFQIGNFDAGTWTSFGSKEMKGPTGLTKSINVSTDFGLRKQEIYLG